MYCPYCGEILTRRDGELYCIAGEMGVAPMLEQMLNARYSPNAPAQSPRPSYSPQIHGNLRWWCPGCGIRLNQYLECDQCGKHLRDLTVYLIELHPHR